MRTGSVRVGTSGWHYDDWAVHVYPPSLPRSRWFADHATRFDTVEINASFYRLPAETTVAGWRAQAPPGFLYAVKGSRYTTHVLKVGGERLPGSVELVTGRVRPLGPHLAVVLWQLPPTLHVDVPRLQRFVDLLPTWTRHAVELRHPSWDDPAVDEVLASRAVSRVWTSSAVAPQRPVVTTDLVYLRFHGLGPALYRHDYTAEELAPWADLVAAAALEGRDALVYFNNDGGGAAVRNGLAFRELVAARAPDALPSVGCAPTWGGDR
jgi:uncharacterized protein YecE (DUF72 family)